MARLSDTYARLALTRERAGMLTEEHEKVFTAAVAAQEEHGGEGVHLEEIARRSGPAARTGP